MPFPFILSTTSHLIFQTNFKSSTHPSLPSATTSQRNTLRAALKAHKRLSVSDQVTNLGSLTSLLLDYLKYLSSIDTSLSGRAVAGEDIDIALTKEIEVEWRPTLASSNVPGKDTVRIKGRGLDYEIYFVHHTFAVLQNLLARQALLGLYSSILPGPEQRVALIQNATKHLKTAYALHQFLIQHANSLEGHSSFPPSAVDVLPSTQAVLQRITLAEINLLCILKDDPYPALLVQSRNKDDKEWMIRAPEIPKVRAQVLTRLCVGASEHATAAIAALNAEGKKISRDFFDYADDLRKTARAKACRFQALDSDLAGQTGQAIAWLYAGLSEVGLEVAKDGGKAKGFSRIKSSWNERKEDRRVEKGSARWGSDAGKAEEIRILEHLERKFTKTNNTINIQIVPEWKPLLTTLPSGMNMPVDDKWKPILLTEDELTTMRAPPDSDDIDAESSGEEESNSVPVGAFPGTQDEYSKTTYY